MARRKYDHYSYYPSTRAISVADGIKARSQRGDFAKNWWAQRWIEALERLMDSGRLSRGRSYARKGQVLSIEEKKASIEARVQGSRRTPYRVSIQIAPLDDASWERVIDRLAEQAVFAADLLAGVMPAGIEAAFEQASASLFPARAKDLQTDCSCPDYANPCKHIAAVYYILGERFDEDPFLLFRLRGRTQEQVLAGLRARRAGQMEAFEEDEADEQETAAPLEDCLEAFWEGAPLEDVPVHIRPPEVEMPLLKRVGEASFAPHAGMETLLRPVYLAAAKKALETAFLEESLTASQNGETTPGQ